MFIPYAARYLNSRAHMLLYVRKKLPQSVRLGNRSTLRESTEQVLQNEIISQDHYPSINFDC
jgi:hypothetical protein